MSEKASMYLCGAGALLGLVGCIGMLRIIWPGIAALFELRHWPFWCAIGGIIVIQIGVFVGKRAAQ